MITVVVAFTKALFCKTSEPVWVSCLWFLPKSVLFLDVPKNLRRDTCSTRTVHYTVPYVAFQNIYPPSNPHHHTEIFDWPKILWVIGSWHGLLGLVMVYSQYTATAVRNASSGHAEEFSLRFGQREHVWLLETWVPATTVLMCFLLRRNTHDTWSWWVYSSIIAYTN